MYFKGENLYFKAENLSALLRLEKKQNVKYTLILFENICQDYRN